MTIASAACLLAVPAAAQATLVSADSKGRKVTIIGDDNANRLVVETDAANPNVTWVTSEQDDLTVYKACSIFSPGVARCAGPAGSPATREVRAKLGDGDDVFRADVQIEGSTVPFVGSARVYAGAGNNSIFGSRQDDRLFGGIGDDLLIGEQGRDFVKGSSGNDLLSGGLQAYPASSPISPHDDTVDKVSCGYGSDSAVVEPEGIWRDRLAGRACEFVYTGTIAS